MTYGCSSSGCGGNFSTTATYSYMGLTHIGALYGDIEWLLIGCGIVALGGAALGIMGNFAKHRKWLMIVTCVVALASVALAVASPVWVAVGQPSACSGDSDCSGACSDWSSGATLCNSFSGSNCPTSVVGVVTYSSCSWGPGEGWYLDIIGAVVLTVGLLLLIIARRDSGSTQTPQASPAREALHEVEPVPPQSPRAPLPPGPDAFAWWGQTIGGMSSSPEPHPRVELEFAKRSKFFELKSEAGNRATV